MTRDMDPNAVIVAELSRLFPEQVDRTPWGNGSDTRGYSVHEPKSDWRRDLAEYGPEEVDLADAAYWATIGHYDAGGNVGDPVVSIWPDHLGRLAEYLRDLTEDDDRDLHELVDSSLVAWRR